MCIRRERQISQEKYNEEMLKLQRDVEAGQLDSSQRDRQAEKLMRAAGGIRKLATSKSKTS